MKMTILHNLETRTFDTDLKPIFHLLRENIDQICFVKNTVGLDNFICIAEENKEDDDFEEVSFGCFKIDDKVGVESESDGYVEEKFLYLEDFREIERKISDLFACSKPLFVYIAFNEAKPTQQSMMRAYSLLNQSDNTYTLIEALDVYTSYPEWYHAKFADDVLLHMDLLAQLEKKQQILNRRLLSKIENEMNEVLRKGDEPSFRSLVKRYNALHNLQKEDAIKPPN